MTDFRFTFDVPVRYADIDAQGHVNHARYFTYMEQARFEYTRALGLWSPADGFAAVGIILAEASCAYHRPVRLGETVRVGVRTVRLGTKSLEQAYHLAVGEAAVARGRVVVVTYDYGAGRSVPIPDAWREKLRSFEGDTLA